MNVSEQGGIKREVRPIRMPQCSTCWHRGHSTCQSINCPKPSHTSEINQAVTWQSAVRTASMDWE